MPEPQRASAEPPPLHLVQIGAVGNHAVMAPMERHPRWLRLTNLPASVCADGANGLTRVSPARAKELGVYAPPGAADVALVGYDRRDLGSRSTWEPKGRLGYGLDAPESGMPEDAQGDWEGFGWLVLDGQAVIQGPRDPAPGAYLSVTALYDRRYRINEAERYFDAAGAPGFVLPSRDLHRFGVRLGDFALLTHGPYQVWAQAFDSGNSGHMVELSVKACEMLGIPDCARSGGVLDGVDITIIPGSRGNLLDALGRPFPGRADDIDKAGAAAGATVGLRIGN